MASEYSYEVGELIQHKRYGYRGVVAGRDATCQADHHWYESNMTQPTRDQPWYHVLVHGAKHTTYVAQENLEVDEGGEQVIHPLAKVFFQHFFGGKYKPREDIKFPKTLH